MRVQVVIIGGGPAGMLLSHILGRAGIDVLVLERRARAHVLSRIRAGVLEAGTCEVLRKHGVGERLDREGEAHDGIRVLWQGAEKPFTIDTLAETGRPMTAYGQTKITEDLYAAHDPACVTLIENAEDVRLYDIESEAPYVTWIEDGAQKRADCDWVAGCDGFHGVSRRSIPESVRREYERVYPFGWLGVMSRVPPLEHISYAHHERGFALASQRGPNLARYYVQCAASDRVEDWSDDRFWSELLARLPEDEAGKVTTGPSIEKSIAPLRSFVSEPMRWGRLCLAGDSAHIVPPTGAKGLNLAVSDVHYLSEALIAHYRGDHGLIDRYSQTALARVWGAIRLSWWLTTFLHTFPEETEFERRLRQTDFDRLNNSPAARTDLAEQVVGLPL
ncbi:p-hydroxybenzoate hydroxylase [Roseivivax jejudonensis]|uniref:p-hydroxybenzoate hydroxylase n=1 Tax=Roseivivax jejudonensis TaxID=1529041 RepID=A0A1X7A5Z5_9RHOB|nr:4-hydroxybenzoate 3-monooxygenase [Roseivivax jejudonensis]SLN71001.1 p-hydroxybenzoate hydroxylase [Roseivivax jejudonensis]